MFRASLGHGQLRGWLGFAQVGLLSTAVTVPQLDLSLESANVAAYSSSTTLTVAAGETAQSVTGQVRFTAGTTTVTENVTIRVFAPLQTGPVLQLPVDGQVGVVPNEGHLRWLASQGAANYRVELSPLADFSAEVQTVDTVNAQADMTGLLAGREYHWRVKGENPCRASSQTADFHDGFEPDPRYSPVVSFSTQ